MGQEGESPTHPRPSGPPVTFYLGKSIRGAYNGSEAQQYVPVGINGYENFKLKMGAENTVPKEVYDQLMNSRSRVVVVDVEAAAKRPHTKDEAAPYKTETLMDYEIHLIKEGK